MKGRMHSLCWPGILTTAALCLALAAGGCGKKAPPFLPQKTITVRVEPLEARWEGGRIILEGRIAGSEEDLSGLVGCTLDHAWYPPEEPPCEGCPIPLSLMGEFREKVFFEERFRCEVDGVKEPGIHFFQVRLLGKDGSTGPPSARVQVNVGPDS